MGLPIEIWICHILPKIDDKSLFSIVEILGIDDILFWKKRTDTNWVMNTIVSMIYSAETYFDIVNQWNQFIKPFVNMDYELLYAERGMSM